MTARSVGIMFVSMAAMAAAYSFIMESYFAIGFTLLLFVHEMGHVLAMRMRGFPLSAPVFIPFLGAMISVNDMGDRDDEAFVGFCGPLLGTLGAALLLLWYRMHPDPLILMLAFFGCLLNLIQLVPFPPLDGGHVMQAVSARTMWIGYGMLAVATWWVPHLLILLMCFIGLKQAPLSGRLRAGAATGLCVLPAIRLITHPPTTGGVVFLLLAVYMAMRFWMYVIRRHPADEDTSEDERPLLPIRLRIAWCAIFIGFALVTIVLLARSVPD